VTVRPGCVSREGGEFEGKSGGGGGGGGKAGEGGGGGSRGRARWVSN